MAGFAKNVFIIIVTAVIVVLAMQYVVPFLKNISITGNVVCDNPYIRHAEGCCLDTDEDKICDDDEGEIAAEDEDVVEAAPAEDETDEDDGETAENTTIPEIAAKIEGFEDFDIVLGSKSADEDTQKMAIKLAVLINYKKDIISKEQANISTSERIYLVKGKNSTVSQLNGYILVVEDGAPEIIATKAQDLADGIDYIGDIKKVSEIDFLAYEKAIYLVTELE